MGQEFGRGLEAGLLLGEDGVAQAEIDALGEQHVEQADAVATGRPGSQVREGLSELGGVVHLEQDVGDQQGRKTSRASETGTISLSGTNARFYLNSSAAWKITGVPGPPATAFMSTRGLRPRGVTVYFRTKSGRYPDPPGPPSPSYKTASARPTSSIPHHQRFRLGRPRQTRQRHRQHRQHHDHDQQPARHDATRRHDRVGGRGVKVNRGGHDRAGGWSLS